MSDSKEQSNTPLMERLRQASAERRRRDDERASAEKSDLEFYQDITRPHLLQTYRFLDELVEHLQYLEEKIEVDYDVPGVGLMKKLVQGQYQMRADTLGDIKQIKFKFVCEAPFDFVVDVRGAEQVREALKSLDRMGMIFSRSDEERNNGIIEHVRLEIRQRFTAFLYVTAELPERAIKFRFRNFEGFGDRVRLVRPEELDEAMLDELARYILREPSSWAVARIDEKGRAELQKKLAQDRRNRGGGFRGLFRQR